MDITSVLTIVAGILFFAIVVLALIYWYMSIKEKSNNEEKSTGISKAPGTSREKDKENKTATSEYTKLSVFDFMEFDNIRDNMIVQDNGSKYLMVIECEGINYDLMSEVEKTAVEQGFVSFLNTLRHPIQLYIQTRTINISNSIENYNKELEKVRQELVSKQNEYNKALQANNVNPKYVDDLRMEIARNQNLYDYGKDIITNTEKMSLNKNVLKKHYFIVIPYYTSELGSNIDDEEEKVNMIFSELYTRAQTLIRTLFACSMKGKVLDSNELADLLYVAYNRDDSEIYGIDKAIKAGFTELYSTAPDVLDKKMEAINKLIDEKAMEKARYAVDKVKTEKEQAIEEKEENIDELIDNLAKIIIKENEQYIGEQTAKKAIKEIENTKEEVDVNGKEETKPRTRRKSTK